MGLTNTNTIVVGGVELQNSYIRHIPTLAASGDTLLLSNLLYRNKAAFEADANDKINVNDNSDAFDVSIAIPYDRAADGDDQLAAAQTKYREILLARNPEWLPDSIIADTL